MGCEVYANGNEIACKKGDGKVIAAFPDVCLSPPPSPAGPIPVPYPNTSFSKDMQNGSKTVKIKGGEIMLKDQSYYKTSPLGDEAATEGLGKGVVTHTITGKTYFIAWSMDVKFEDQNADRHIDLTTSNHASPNPNDAVPDPNSSEATTKEKPPEPCASGHTWIEVSRETPEETKRRNAENAKILKSKPSKAKSARGPEFENEAIDANMERLQIEATSLVYRCAIEGCNVQQEVDIRGKDRIAEAKSRTPKGTKNAGQQQRNYLEIQRQLMNPEVKPLGKLDGERSDTLESIEHYARRGLDFEVVIKV